MLNIIKFVIFTYVEKVSKPHALPCSVSGYGPGRRAIMLYTNTVIGLD